MSLFKIIGGLKNKFIFVAPPVPVTTLERIAAGTKSDEIFNLPFGVNEFDIITPSQSPDNLYHLFYDIRTPNATAHRQAATFQGLATAQATIIKDLLRYPCAIYKDGFYHLWGRNFGTTGATEHYKSATIAGLMNAVPADLNDYGIDFSVIKNPNGTFTGAGKDAVDAYPFTNITTNLNNTFTNRLQTFNKQNFCSNSVTDESLFYDKAGDMWMLFGATKTNPPTQQTIGIAKINPLTRLIIGNPIEIITPTKAWEGNLIFNPVYIIENGIERIYYSANKGDETTPLNGGVGYLQLY